MAYAVIYFVNHLHSEEPYGFFRAGSGELGLIVDEQGANSLPTKKITRKHEIGLSVR